MARSGKSLVDLAAEIERRAEAKKDFVAPVPKFEIAVVDNTPVIAMQNGSVHEFPINDLAHGQIAEFSGIPMAYYRRMMEDDPKLLAENINRWLKDKTADKRLIRTLDGKVRAFLSNGYRTLENEDLFEAVAPVLLEKGLIIISSEITDRRLYIKAVDKNIQRDIPTGKHMGDGGHTIFDTISPGITISNSETGSGALSVEEMVYTWACTNLAMSGRALRKYHTGKRAEISDDVFQLLTDETKRATDRAVWMQTRDMVAGAFDHAKFEAQAAKLAGATADKVEPEQVVEVVKRVARKFSFTEVEQKGVLGALIKDGDLTRYGIHSAITRYSQEEVVAYDRATELERLGGDVIDLSPSEWREVSKTTVAA